MKKIILSITLLLVVILLLVTQFAPPVVDKKMNPVQAHEAYEVSAQAKQLHASLIIGDWHADTMLWKRNISKEHDYSHVDIPRLQQGNVGLQMFTTVTKSPSGLNYASNSANAWDDITTLALLQLWPPRTWTSLTERALYQANKLHAFARKNSNDLMIIQNKNDLKNWQIKRQNNQRLIGGLIGTEGNHALDGKLENVQQLYNAGFRMMSLQHFFDNRLGGSLHGESQTGLTPFGKQVIEEMKRLDIILDVSHSSPQVVKDVLDFYDRPIVVSHTGFQGHCATNRNISDELMRRIAEKGGLIAVGYWDGAVCGEEPKDIVAAIKYGLELVGENHLSLCSVFDGTVTTGLHSGELAALTQEMLDQNFSESQIRKIMGGNMLTLLKSHLPD